MRLAGALFVIAALAACRDGADETAPPGSGGGDGQACAIGDMQTETGECCPPGTLFEAGACQPAGVASCAEGFAPDGSGGCEPILPASPCGEGEMALPGERSCRPVMDCGSAPWGAIALDATTEHVDAAYAGGASDGSAEQPWTTIQAGIAAAAPGAIVAVAQGSYAEELTIAKSVRLLGRCPALVEVVGQGGVSTVLVQGGANDAELDGLAITGPNMGIVVSGAVGVKLSRLWVHDLGGRGVDLENTFGATSALLSGTLIERARDASVILLSAEITIEDTVVRDALHAGGNARGLVVKRAQGSSIRSRAFVNHSIIERTAASGIIVEVSDLEVHGSIIRDVAPELASGEFGRGLELQDDPLGGEIGNAVLRGSLIERTHDSAIFVVGSPLVLEDMVVRDTASIPASGIGGEGVLLQPRGARRASATVRTSLLVRHRESGIIPLGSDLLVERTIVRDMLLGRAPIDDGVAHGVGIFVQDDLDSGARSAATIRGSIIERAAGQALRVAGSDAWVEGLAVLDPQPAEDGSAGNGVALIHDPMTGNLGYLELRSSSFDRCLDAGLLVNSSRALFENVVVRDTQPHTVRQVHGAGVVSQHWPLSDPAPETTLRRVHVERSQSFGILAVGGTLHLDGVRIVSVGPQPSDGIYGDGVALLQAAATVAASRIEQAARVGIANFSGSAEMKDTALECNVIALSRQDISGPTSFTDLGGNRCGCGETTEACKATSTSIDAPSPLE